MMDACGNLPTLEATMGKYLGYICRWRLYVGLWKPTVSSVHGVFQVGEAIVGVKSVGSGAEHQGL